MNYGMNLVMALKEKGTNIYRLAKTTGISATTLYSAIQRNSGVRYDHALHIAEILGIKPELIYAHVPSCENMEGSNRMKERLAEIGEARKRILVSRAIGILMDYDTERLEKTKDLLTWFGKTDLSGWNCFREMMEVVLRHHPVKSVEEKMDWRKELEKAAGTVYEKDIVDLTDMEKREILDERHLEFMTGRRQEKAGSDSNVTEGDSHL